MDLSIQSSPEAPSYHVRVLGRFAVRQDLSALSVRPTLRRLIAYLAVEGMVDRADAAAHLFEDLPAPRAMGNLRTVLWRAREDAPGLIVESGDGLALRAATVDLSSVSDWCNDVLCRTEPISLPPAGTGQELLPSWSEYWLVESREHFHVRQLYALESAAGQMLLSSRLAEAVSCALRAVSLDPLRESAHRILIEVLLREGNSVEALRRYQRFESTLLREANARPGLVLQSLIAPVLASGAKVPTAEHRWPAS